MHLTHTRRSAPASILAIGAIAALVLTGCSPEGGGDGGDSTVKLSFSTFLGENDANSKAMQYFMDEVTERTGGRITFDAYYSGTLVGAAESLAAAADGRADITVAGSFYHQQEWPLTTVVELPLVSTNTPAQSAALKALYETDEDYAAEFANSGVHLLWPGVLSTAILGTAEPIESIDDLKGLKLRSGGLSGRFLKDLGVDVVEVPSSEIYQSMQTGLIEGYASIVISQVPQFGLQELTHYVTDGWYGGFAVAPFIMNASVYESLDDDLRATIDEVADEMIAKSAEFLHDIEGAACDELAAAGVEVGMLDESLVDDLRPKAEEYEQQWIQDRSAGGFDAEGFLALYREKLSAAEAEYDVSMGAARCEVSD